MEQTNGPVSSDLSNEIQTSDIYVDAEGEWYNEGSKIIREEIVELFLSNLHPGPDGTFFIELEQKRCSIRVEDTPLVIARSERVKGEGAEDEIFLKLKYLPSAEPLDPSTLYVGKDNVLYCRVRQGRLPARFSRAAYYQLAEWIEEDSQTGEFYVELGGRRHIITVKSD